MTRTDNGGAFWDTVFDVVSLCFSVAEVVANPSDPWAWAGLVGDAVDLIPFVTGVGEVTRAVSTGRKVLKAADTADAVHDAAKVAKKAPIVVGENMKRVKKYAEEIGADVYLSMTIPTLRFPMLETSHTSSFILIGASNHFIYRFG